MTCGNNVPILLIATVRVGRRGVRLLVVTIVFPPVTRSLGRFPRLSSRSGGVLVDLTFLRRSPPDI